MSRDTMMVYAHGQGDEWEAICTDLDIAVQGRSLDEVKQSLLEAIALYVEHAHDEAPEVTERLLNRRAPLSVRVSLAAQFLLHLLRRRRPREQLAVYDMPCHA